ncbi:MAG: polysaccharide lyase family 8 super-sandwich domain-containing protein, partial [Armatimonadota bacterium]
RIYANWRDLPIALKGRSPFAPGYGVLSGLGLKAMDMLARCGTPDGTQEIDTEVAAAYLRLVPEAADDEPYRSLRIEPEPSPNGSFVMPYAGLLCHRRDDWLAGIKGQSKYVWGSERQAQRNCYGLFQGLGNLEILAGGDPVTAEDSGRVEAGWDWRRFEGTTVPQLPLEVIDRGWPSSRPRSAETFVGGVSYQNRQGIFAMILNQPMPGDRTLTGRKSWFFNDDEILCLGSDISCDEPDYATQTTLCQKALRADDDGNYPVTPLDGEKISDFPDERVLEAASPHWFIDIQQTGYYIPAGQNVTVARRQQVSRDFLDREDTEGDFLAAWLDHGTAPEDAAYEYMLVVRATAERMATLGDEMPYQVIQRDEDAHIVWHTEARRWSGVFFVPQEIEAHTVSAETIPVHGVDRPCLIMSETSDGERLAMSVADPDLNLQDGASQPNPLRVTLRGSWSLQQATARVCQWPLNDSDESARIVSADADTTVLEIICRHGATYDLKLQQVD